ncbi:MAG: ABC transporter ATP-binding protein [Deltaproteobacteria bacterium]|nr:ABC transporter ATP-binding protein [Deltaproteobacteria bacterium]
METRGLCKIFRRGYSRIEVLRDVSVKIRDGEFVSVVGASGCGKTTFLRILDGLIEPSSGTVAIDGKVVAKPGSDRGFVFQQDGLFPWRTVLGNTVFGPEVQRKEMNAARRLARTVLQLVGLEGFDSYYPHELSGGMRQRVNLARALTVGPEVLLMDEPFAALDAQTREIMQAELLRIWREAKKTVVFVTHQIDEAVYLSDRVLVFTVRPGRIKEEVSINLPRPRELMIKRTPEFVRYTDKIWRWIEEEVRVSLGREVEEAISAHR